MERFSGTIPGWNAEKSILNQANSKDKVIPTIRRTGGCLGAGCTPDIPTGPSWCEIFYNTCIIGCPDDECKENCIKILEACGLANSGGGIIIR